jgi:hypothetical protein
VIVADVNIGETSRPLETQHLLEKSKLPQHPCVGHKNMLERSEGLAD